MRMLLDDKMDDYTIVAASEDADYPAPNAQDPRLSRYTRTTGLSSQTWKIDAGVGNTITASAAAIIGHNITSGATIKIQGNATDSWGSPTVDETFTHSSGLMVKFFTQSSLRFWRFLVTDASNPDGYIEIGRLFLCTYYQFEELPGSAFTERVVDTTRRDFSQSGQAYSDIGILYEVYEIDLELIEDATRQALKTQLELVRKHKPLILLPDENNTSKLPALYCVLDSDQMYTHAGGWSWRSGVLRFREVL